ncbi:hypothetical protein KBB06_04085 [Candidatus Gracilibacteria bacterium]|nr:hypothetical protein [Candidatus Gracilibacteria bacterium]
MLKKVSLILFSVSLLGITFMPFITSALGPVQISTLQMNQGMIIQEVPDSFIFDPAFIPFDWSSQEIRINKVLNPNIASEIYKVRDQNSDPNGPNGFVSRLHISNFNEEGGTQIITRDKIYFTTLANSISGIDPLPPAVSAPGFLTDYNCGDWAIHRSLDQCSDQGQLYKLTTVDPGDAGVMIINGRDDAGGRLGAFAIGLGLRIILNSTDGVSPPSILGNQWTGTLTFDLLCFNPTDLVNTDCTPL